MRRIKYMFVKGVIVSLMIICLYDLFTASLPPLVDLIKNYKLVLSCEYVYSGPKLSGIELLGYAFVIVAGVQLLPSEPKDVLYDE